MQFVHGIVFQEAKDKLGSKSVIGAQLSSPEWADVPVGLRERAFFSSRVESVRFLQRSKDFLGDFLSGTRETVINPYGKKNPALKAGSRAQFVKELRAMAKREGLGPLDPRDKGTIKDITSEARLQLIFDTQTRQAQDFGYWKQGMDPDVLDAFPAQRFIRERSVKEARDRHRPFEDQVRLKTDQSFWLRINQDFNVPWGPWGWGCGHGVEDVDREEAEALGLLGPDDILQPVDKSFNDDLAASTRGLDPEMVDFLQQNLGDQVEFTGNDVQWRRPSSSPRPVALPTAPPSRKAPVSQGLDVKPRGVLSKIINEALKAIDSVHDDGVLPKIPVHSYRGRDLGVFVMDRGTQNGREIKVRRTGNWPALTTVHEVGHFLDRDALGARGSFASVKGDMKSVMDAIHATKAYKALDAGYSQTKSSRLQYLLKPYELWARAYAQYIATRAGSPVLKNDLDRAIKAEPNRQWAPEDFSPVAQAIDKYFKEKGWK